MFASLGRTKYSNVAAREVVAAALSKRSPCAHAVKNLTRFPIAFRQFSLRDAIPFAGGDAVVTPVQWPKPFRESGYAVPRGALYALRVFDEALRMPLPVRTPAVLAAARVLRPMIRKRAPLLPYEAVLKILSIDSGKYAEDGTIAFAPGISLMILASYRWSGTKWAADMNLNDDVARAYLPKKAKTYTAPFYWGGHLEGLAGLRAGLTRF